MSPAPPLRRANRCTGRRALGLVLATLAAFWGTTGCDRAPWKTPPRRKYQTAPASGRANTEQASAKHAEALAMLENEPRDLAKAERLLDEALVADVRYGPAHNSLGMAYYLQNKLYLAAWEFEYAATLMPELAQPYNNLGLVYERAGKREEAASYYAMALSRSENDPDAMSNLVRVRLAMGERGADLKAMISELALRHPEAKWRVWARDQVELAKFDEPASALRPSFAPSADGPENSTEALPAPVRDDDAPPLKLPQSLAPEGGS